VALRAIRGAIQLDADEREHLLASVAELVGEILARNDLTVDDLVSILFTATGDLCSEFPAVGARRLGIVDVPLLCAREIDVTGAMPRVIRALVHAETPRPRDAIQHVYLRGAVALRLDIAQ
jgi:chorismate mutase